MKRISQRRARLLAKRVEQLERDERERVARWSSTYPGGAHIATIAGLPDRTDGILYAAALIGCAIVGRWDERKKELLLYAVVPKRG